MHAPRSERGACPAQVAPGGRWALSPKVSELALSPRGLAGHRVLGMVCTDVYRGFSDCVLKLGENMATYKEEESIEPQGLHRVCG